MVFTDWTMSGSGGTAALDGVTKYAGASSVKIASRGGSATDTNVFTHNSFSQSQVQCIFWCRENHYLPYGYTNNAYINLSTYGSLNCTPSTMDTWYHYRCSFWYDATTNTKWGRIEVWSGSAWVQVGGDSNLGSGSPAAGSLSLQQYYNGNSGASNGYIWFDEVEVYV